MHDLSINYQFRCSSNPAKNSIAYQVLDVLQDQRSWDFAVLFKDFSDRLINLRQLQTVEAFWVESILNGSLELGIRMHD